MDINEIEDLKTSENRIGDRQFSTLRKKVKFALMVVVVLLIGYIFATQIQNYLKSFSTNKAEMVKKFEKIENVPSWTIVFKK